MILSACFSNIYRSAYLLGRRRLRGYLWRGFGRSRRLFGGGRRLCGRCLLASRGLFDSC
nr:MAG TPA: hypothetical protein [Caudoviricetes sp.]DAU49072.1 MAG TPA: hypothetical protein [Caudoviricetes sp.]